MTFEKEERKKEKKIQKFKKISKVQLFGTNLEKTKSAKNLGQQKKSR